MVFLRCMDRHEADLLITEVHEGSFGTHSNRHAMAKNMLRAGYYWVTMESDYCKFVKKRHKCQIYAYKIHVPPTLLNVISSPWPFSMWGIDMIGMIETKASSGHRFILVAIDYFTKWVEAESYANVTKQVIVRFIMNQIICRYGVPRATPFSLVYGMEVILPVEVETLSLRVLMEAKLTEDEWCQTRVRLVSLVDCIGFSTSHHPGRSPVRVSSWFLSNYLCLSSVRLYPFDMVFPTDSIAFPSLSRSPPSPARVKPLGY
ncbi:hypothetical protein KIW84_035297 [Lathyrus oleraceus]|uniref:Gypsy retrotransposon integrase-like protein 1 n=1 Tax=Pisum sativum TaxID=3888 RepID=A0A9D5B6H9_PEA|nr:hypothetical protein KIW84_035297 [Pisum sativum]